MEVLVFKTNLRYKKQVRSIQEKIDAYPGIVKWNFDMHDADKILRVVSVNVQPSKIENLLHNAGYRCEELPD